MIETIHLLPGVTLRVCRDTRFKQGCLSVQFVRKMDKQEAALNALLPNVLLRGTRRFPDLQAITERLDELYGAAVGPSVRRSGDYQTTGLYCGFIDDRFAMAGDRIVEPVIGFLEELLLDPAMETGRFLPSFVESEKRNLISTIESERNDKRSYAISQLLRTMSGEDTFGLPRLGDPEQVEAIDPDGLYRHYQKVLRQSPIEIFYVGSAESREVEGMIMPLLRHLDREPEPLPPQTGFHPGKGGDTVETMDVAQGKLCMGFVTPITNRSPEFPAMQVLNTIFGSGMTSKLFLNIREKMSLCYSISSMYYGSKGVAVVTAGIDFDKEELTRREVLNQLQACREGKISDEELAAGKAALISSLRAVHDSPGSIESYYAAAALSGLNYTHENYMAAVERVTLADVRAAARQLSLHTTYFLRGESQ